MASAKNSGAACRSRTAADVPYSMSSGCATTQSTRRKDSSGRAGKAMPAILPDLFPAGDGPAVCTARWAATLYGAPSLTTRASSLADAGTLPSCRNPNCEIAASTDCPAGAPCASHGRCSREGLAAVGSPEIPVTSGPAGGDHRAVRSWRPVDVPRAFGFVRDTVPSRGSPPGARGLRDGAAAD